MNREVRAIHALTGLCAHGLVSRTPNRLDLLGIGH